MALRSYALMKPAPSSARFSIGSSVRSNAGSPVVFSKSAMTTETGSCAAGGINVRAYHQTAAEQRDGQRITAASSLHADDALDGDRRARVVEAIESRFEFGGRLKALVRIGLEAARDERVERLRDVRSDASVPAPAPAPSGLQLGDRAFSGCAPRAADEHVVEDQAERVDVRALIDRRALGLLRRHVLDRPDDALVGHAGDHAASRPAEGAGEAPLSTACGRLRTRSSARCRSP